MSLFLRNLDHLERNGAAERQLENSGITPSKSLHLQVCANKTRVLVNLLGRYIAIVLGINSTFDPCDREAIVTIRLSRRVRQAELEMTKGN